MVAFLLSHVGCYSSLLGLLCTGQTEGAGLASHLSLEQGSYCTRFFSTSLSQWILTASRMSSSLVPMWGTFSCSSSDPASCLYSIFTSWKWQHTPQWVQDRERKDMRFWRPKLSSMRDTWLLILLLPAGLHRDRQLGHHISFPQGMASLSWSSQSQTHPKQDSK